MTQAPCDTLLLLAPSVRLLDFVEKKFAAMKQAGQDVPEKDTRWLATWRLIYSDQPAPVVDHLTDEEWSEIGERVIGVETGTLWVPSHK
jgi:hypothetical protein